MRQACLMSEVPYPSDGERLLGNIREEIQAQSAGSSLRLTDEDVERLAISIASNVEYGFDVRWAPRWIKGDDPHRWVEGPDTTNPTYFVECLRHKRITMHESETDATNWWSGHVQAEHS